MSLTQIMGFSYSRTCLLLRSSQDRRSHTLDANRMIACKTLCDLSPNQRGRHAHEFRIVHIMELSNCFNYQKLF